MDPRKLNIRDYSYHLPEDKIALYPKEERDLSRLLIYKNGQIQESQYRFISGHLPAHSRLVFNNTRVVRARLQFTTETGATIEIFCLEPHQMEVATAMASGESQVWKCFVGRVKKWKEYILSMQVNGLTLHAQMIESLGDSYLIKFSWEKEGGCSFSEVLLQAGNIPIPPYLKRNSEDLDLKRYQTVYARIEGSVAAPTAGLHFTENLLSNLASKDIVCSYVTLHVGAGTFKPVKAERLEGHSMHAEWIVVQKSFLEEYLDDPRTTIPVGTTSLRTLESIYWMGVKSHHHPELSIFELGVKQWDPYELAPVDRNVALQALLKKLTEVSVEEFCVQTSIIIAPGYQIRMANALITNFHQPESTLILLVAACVGDHWKKIYNYALEHDFRFLSYGDGSLLNF